MENASFEDFLGKATTHSSDFEDMRLHIKQMYSGVTAEKVTSFRIGNHYVDCIAIEEQATVSHFNIKTIKTPPKPGVAPSSSNGTTRGSHNAADSLLKRGLMDEFGQAISCPDHMIPMSRLTLEKLTRFTTLRDFFGKSPDRSDSTTRPRAPASLVPRDPRIRKYAVAVDPQLNLGGSSTIELWNPVADFSLSQQWYINGGQSIEGGWIVYPARFATTDSVLFIFWTPDNYNTGCYNLDCPGFVQTSNHWYFGGPLWSEYSIPSSRWAFGMQWQWYEGDWWLHMSPSGDPGTFESVGYYPSSIFDGFQGQLSVHAELLEVGGEVGEDGHWPPMGSGVLATEGFTVGANQFSIFYLPQDPAMQGMNEGQGLWTNLIPHRVDLPCYALEISNYPDGVAWGTFIVYGGPGGDTITCG